MNAEFDVALWDGSSFVGKSLAEYSHQEYAVDSGLRWAIGGRNRRKLEATRASFGAGAEVLAMIVSNARDRQFLDSMVVNTEVVFSTVGPYLRCGNGLITACVASGTDYTRS